MHTRADNVKHCHIKIDFIKSEFTRQVQKNEINVYFKYNRKIPNTYGIVEILMRCLACLFNYSNECVSNPQIEVNWFLNYRNVFVSIFLPNLYNINLLIGELW